MTNFSQTANVGNVEEMNCPNLSHKQIIEEVFIFLKDNYVLNVFILVISNQIILLKSPRLLNTVYSVATKTAQNQMDLIQIQSSLFIHLKMSISLCLPEEVI